MSSTAFRPSEHGFPFDPRYEYPGTMLGLGAPLDPEFGVRAGMCWAALDRFLAGRRVPRTLDKPRPGEPLYMELMQRQANALTRAGWERALKWQQRPETGGRPKDPDLAELTRREWPQIKRTLDAGVPVMLFLVRASGPFGNPSENRHVLAWDYAVEESTDRLTLRVYDPGQPSEDGIRLVLQLSPRRAPLGARLGRDERVRGFFAVPYDRASPPQFLPAVPAGVGEDAIRLQSPPAAIPTSAGVYILGRVDGGDVAWMLRRPSGHWSSGRITARRKGTQPPRLVDGPVASSSKKPRAYCRTEGGSLIELRLGRWGWKMKNLHARRGMAPYRVDGHPAVLHGPGPRTSVMATREGRLFHFERIWPRRWRAEDINRRLRLPDSFAIAGDVYATEGPDHTQFVGARGVNGDLLCFCRPPRSGWIAENATESLGGFDHDRIATDPSIICSREGELHAFGTSDAGHLIHFRRRVTGRWITTDLTAALRSTGEDHCMDSRPVCLEGPGGTLHIFGRGPRGDLIHYRRVVGGWRAEDLTRGRPTIGSAYRLAGPPLPVAGANETMHVLARGPDDLLLYRWSTDGDWVAEALGRDRWHETATSASGPTGPRVGSPSGAPACEPVVVTDAGRHPHVLWLDREGVLRQAGPAGETVAERMRTADRRALEALADVLRSGRSRAANGLRNGAEIWRQVLSWLAEVLGMRRRRVAWLGGEREYGERPPAHPTSQRGTPAAAAAPTADAPPQPPPSRTVAAPGAETAASETVSTAQDAASGPAASAPVVSAPAAPAPAASAPAAPAPVASTPESAARDETTPEAAAPAPATPEAAAPASTTPEAAKPVPATPEAAEAAPSPSKAADADVEVVPAEQSSTAEAESPTPRSAKEIAAELDAAWASLSWDPSTQGKAPPPEQVEEKAKPEPRPAATADGSGRARRPGRAPLTPDQDGDILIGEDFAPVARDGVVEPEHERAALDGLAAWLAERDASRARRQQQN